MSLKNLIKILMKKNIFYLKMIRKKRKREKVNQKRRRMIKRKKLRENQKKKYKRKKLRK